jgi:hypothetical protein
VIDPTLIETIRQKFEALRPFLDERTRRVWAATEAAALGRGGVTLVARATGMARSTLHAGQRDLQEPEAARLTMAAGRLRRAGAGRKPLTEQDPALIDALEALVDPLARGDPESPLRWTTKSTRQLAAVLSAQGHPISHVKVAELLKERDYSLQGTRKVQEGASHPDRDAQFAYINAQAETFQAQGEPAIRKGVHARRWSPPSVGNSIARRSGLLPRDPHTTWRSAHVSWPSCFFDSWFLNQADPGAVPPLEAAHSLALRTAIRSRIFAWRRCRASPAKVTNSSMKSSTARMA